jgi:hypothetical protein
LEKHSIKIGRETLRRWMVADGLWLSRKQRRSFGVWQRFATNRAILPQVIQAERVINCFFARRGYRGEVWTTVHSIQVIENEGHIEMRAEQELLTDKELGGLGA